MRNKITVGLLIGILLLLKQARSVLAISDPPARSNNKVGVHILDPNEVDKVGDLVNSNGGNWGYVTVPLRADDRDRIKWQGFFDVCKEERLIPIIRLATTMKPYGWDKPTLYDAVDFANFLNDLDWPVKNKYVAVYNEPNHAKEWGGSVDPVDYGRILQFTAQILKERSGDFYILPAGLDAAAPNDGNHRNLYNFISQMNSAYPQALQNIDGWNSHSYPNPGFSGSPKENHHQSIASFRHELDFIKNLIGRNLPVFITETGWQNRALSDETVAEFYREAFKNVWSREEVVAVTPFILLAGDGSFKPFSLLEPTGEAKPQYLAIKNINKVSGDPEKATEMIASKVLGTSQEQGENVTPLLNQSLSSWGKENWRKFFKWLMVK